MIPFGLVSAQTSKPATKKHTSIQEDLIAYNKVIPRIMNVVDSAALKKRLEQEYNEYPALDLYGDNWNTEWVNPYKSTVQNAQRSRFETSGRRYRKGRIFRKSKNYEI